MLWSTVGLWCSSFSGNAALLCLLLTTDGETHEKVSESASFWNLCLISRGCWIIQKGELPVTWVKVFSVQFRGTQSYTWTVPLSLSAAPCGQVRHVMVIPARSTAFLQRDKLHPVPGRFSMWPACDGEFCAEDNLLSPLTPTALSAEPAEEKH